jgi:translation initiation factor 4E
MYAQEQIHFFRGDSRAMWEDPENVNGGLFQIVFQSGHAGAPWERLLLDFIGETLHPDLFGATITHRKDGERLQIWNRTADDRDLLLVHAGQLIKTLDLPFKTRIEFKAHMGGKAPVKEMKFIYEANGPVIIP